MNLVIETLIVIICTAGSLLALIAIVQIIMDYIKFKRKTKYKPKHIKGNIDMPKLNPDFYDVLDNDIVRWRVPADNDISINGIFRVGPVCGRCVDLDPINNIATMYVLVNDFLD